MEYNTEIEAIEKLCELDDSYIIKVENEKYKIIKKEIKKKNIIESENNVFIVSDGSRGIFAEVIYGDTDSIYTMFKIPGQDKMSKEEILRKIWDVASECADRISETFIKPIELENEKTMWPLYLYGKKRYANLYYEEQKDGTFSCKKDFKGIQVVRRDNCQYVKTVCNPVFDKLLYDQDIDGAKDIARNKIKELLKNKVELEELILSKSLKSKYKTVNKAGNKISLPAHWHLAEKLKKRDPGTAPKAGDRIPYIFIENPKAVLQADKVEDPEYIKANPNKCKPDVLYYLDKQLASPLYTIFEVIVTDPKTGKVFPRKVKNDGSEVISKECKNEIARLLWKRARQDKQNEIDGNQSIMKWLVPVNKSKMVEEE